MLDENHMINAITGEITEATEEIIQENEDKKNKYEVENKKKQEEYLYLSLKLLQLRISKSETNKDESEKQFEESDFSGILPCSTETQVILKAASI
jgi:hypothetical protein